MRRISAALIVLLGLACISPESWAAAVGSEFPVNTHTNGQQHASSVARLTDGGFVVIWQSGHSVVSQDGSSSGVYGQRYDAAGAPAGGEFPVNTYTTNDQSDPSVAGLLLGGGFVVVWTSFGQDGSRSGVYGRRYNAAGAPLGDEARINVYTNDDQMAPSVAALNGGGFVVAWTSHGKKGVFARRYKATGVPDGGEFRVNSYTKNSQSAPSVAGLTGGGFVVTWQSVAQDNSGYGVYAQRYTAGGTRVGSEFRVHTNGALDQAYPAVAGLTAGGFVIAWNSFAQDDSLNGVYGQRYISTGAAAGAEFRINTQKIGNQQFPSVAGLSDGGFVVTWESPQSVDPFNIFGQLYGPTGAPVGSEFRVNTYSNSSQRVPSVAPLGSNGFVAAWHSWNQDGNGNGIFGQRFEDTAPKITLHPVNQTVFIGLPASFTADASGTPAPTVQWQSRVGLRGRFIDILGATAKTLTFIATPAQSGNQYRAVFSNAAGNTPTNAAILSVIGRPRTLAGGVAASTGRIDAR